MSTNSSTKVVQDTTPEDESEVSQEEVEALLALARAEMGGAMTREERCRYLRERGIQIEEVTKATSSNLVEEARSAWLLKSRGQPSEHSESFSYLLLPADDTRPVMELRSGISAGDVLPSLLASSFAGGSISDAVLLQTAKEHGEQVGVNALRQAASQGGTEVFRLAAPSNGEIVNAYFDDCAALKELTLNVRASKLAQLCGFDEACTFQGDVYIGRLKYDADLVSNVSIALGELEAGSLWLQRAPIENLRFQKEIQPVAHAMAEQVAQFNSCTSGAGDGYAWEDAKEDLEIVVFTDTSEQEAKVPVKVNFARRQIDMVSPRPYAWKLFACIDPEGCSWTYCEKGILIYVQKEVEGRWPQLCTDLGCI